MRGMTLHCWPITMGIRKLLLIVTFFLSPSAMALTNGIELKNDPDLVRLNFSGNEAVCTGFFIDPTTIITAAHCLYKSSSKNLWDTEALALSNDTNLQIKIKTLNPHPAFRPGESAYDIGIIKTSENANFKGSYDLDLLPTDRVGTAQLFGAGRIDLDLGTYGRSQGSASFYRFGSNLYSFGKSKRSSNPGTGVTIAPNDSGGPILNARSGKVIAVGVRTTVNDTKGTFLPAISIGTLVSEPSIQSFLTKYRSTKNMPVFKSINRPEIKVIGIQTRTNNKAEMTGAGKIGPLWQQYFQEGIQAKIPNKVNQDVTLSVYTNYETDETGPYSVTIGCEVSNFDDVPPGLVKIVLPAQKYAVLTTKRGAIPGIILDAWKAVWSATSEQLGGVRFRGGDFELYDARSRDPKNAEVDIYVGVR